MQRTILLFDVDGVLVHPGGYKEALRATLNEVAHQFGQLPIDLTDDEMSVFEAVHLTNEWDSAAMVAASLVIDALAIQPDLCTGKLEGTITAIRAAGISIPRRDLRELARECMAAHQ